MSPVSKLLRRLGVASVGACTLLATPSLGGGAAFATPNPTGTAPTITILSQATGSTPFPASTKSDGTGSAVRIFANFLVPAAGDPTYLPVASVRFSYQTGSAATSNLGTSVVIGSATGYPYTIDWTPPANGVYTETAETLNANGATETSVSKAVLVDSTLSSLRVLTPSYASPGGVNSAGNMLVTGTRSADLPGFNMQVYTRDNTTGTFTITASAVGVGPGTPGVGVSNTWSVLTTPNACPANAGGNCDIFVNAYIGAAAGGNMTQAPMYTQTFGGIALTPATATRSTNSAQVYTATLTDQRSLPVVGTALTISKTSGNPTLNSLVPTTGVAASPVALVQTTNLPVNTATYSLPAGTVQFTATDVTAEVSGLTVTTGATASDVSRSATLTSTANSAITATFKTLGSTPTKALYATNNPAAPASSEYNAAGAIWAGGPPVAPAANTGPYVELCLTDTTGTALDANAGNLAKVVASLTRTTKTGSAVTVAAATSPALVSDQTNNPGCFLVPHLAAGTEEEGNDAFTAFVNQDGVPGYQAGGTDVQAAPLTLKYGVLKITSTGTQAQKGTAATVPFLVATADGTPFTGRTNMTLAVTTGSPTLPSIQPTGSIRLTSTTANCATDSNGVCTFNVSDTAANADVLTLTDTADPSNPAKVATTVTGTSAVSFRTLPTTLLTAVVPVLSTLSTGGNFLVQPLANLTTSGKLRPGDAQHYSVTLNDANTPGATTSTLAGVQVVVTVDNGFFTPDCTVYTACSFSTPPADGQVTGILTNSGKTATLTSNAAGVVNFSTAIGLDPQLSKTGVQVQNATVTGGGGAVPVIVTPGSPAGTAALANFTTVGDALANGNGGTVTLVPVASTDLQSGNVTDNGSNKISGQANVATSTGTNFQVRITDQFGNLIQYTAGVCPVALSVAGGGYLAPVNTTTPTTAAACGSYPAGSTAEVFHLDTDSTSTAGLLNTVTASWNAPATLWKAVTPATVPPSFTTVTGTAVPQTATFAITLYALDAHALVTTQTTNPSTSSVPINTIVTAGLSVVDQKNTPVRSLRVTFERTGPLNGSGSDNQYLTGFGYLSSAGAVSFTFTSGTAGLATVNLTLVDGTGNALTRNVVKTTFVDGSSPTPSPTVSPTPTPTVSPTPTPTPTPTASPTPSPTAPAGAVTIGGGDQQTPAYGSTFVITGTAPAGAVVSLNFHKAGTAATDYSLVRTVTADANGNWTRAITTNVDYRYYASVGSTQSNNVLSTPAPTVDGALARVVPRNALYTLIGTAIPGTRVYLHFHAPGTAATDYSIVRMVVADGSGHWTRPYLATTDYRLYVSRSAGDSANHTSYLVQPR